MIQVVRKFMAGLRRAKILDRSGRPLRPHKSIQPLRAGHFRVEEKVIAGDAPKDFVRVYQYGVGKKAKPRSWPAYIAKVGQKWYPNESITEHLLTRIGQRIDIPMADSRLMLAKGQLRFLSRYFLKPNESLVHGAEIFADYLQDLEFVEEVEKANQARDLFTFQFVEEAIMDRFGDHSAQIMRSMVRLLGFDAIVGNNDRHFYNWGVIIDSEGLNPPRFSPIYDTARGLFWNTTERRLEEIARSSDMSWRKLFLSKYVDRCYPKTGWEGLTNPNHFELVNRIAAHDTKYREALRPLHKASLLEDVASLFSGEFSDLFSTFRQDYVLECLRMRQEMFVEAITSPS